MGYRLAAPLERCSRGPQTAAVLADLAAIVHTLRRGWGARHVVLSGIPPVGRFPALP